MSEQITSQFKLEIEKNNNREKRRESLRSYFKKCKERLNLYGIFNGMLLSGVFLLYVLTWIFPFIVANFWWIVGIVAVIDIIIFVGITPIYIDDFPFRYDNDLNLRYLPMVDSPLVWRPDKVIRSWEEAHLEAKKYLTSIGLPNEIFFTPSSELLPNPGRYIFFPTHWDNSTVIVYEDSGRVEAPRIKKSMDFKQKICDERTRQQN